MPAFPRYMLSTARTLVVPAHTTRCPDRILREFSSLTEKRSACQRVTSYRLKSAESDVQSDVGNPGLGVAASLQDFRREMQPSGRCGNGSTLASEYGLVAIAISRSVLTPDIRGQRDVADLFQHLMDVAVVVESDGAFAEIAPPHDFRFDIVAENYALAGFHPAAGMHQGDPGFLVVAYRFHEQHFHLSA